MEKILKVFNELIETTLHNSSNNEAVITNVKLWAESWQKEMEEAINYNQCCKSDSEQFICKDCGHTKTAVNTTIQKICCAKCRAFAN